jgi:hypothetical protein
METQARCYSNSYRWKSIEMGHYAGLFERYRETLYEMREAGLLTDEQVQKRLKLHFEPEKLKEYLTEQADPVVQESVGPSWHESREFWRAELLKAFPEPAEAEPAA